MRAVEEKLLEMLKNAVGLYSGLSPHIQLFLGGSAAYASRGEHSPNAASDLDYFIAVDAPPEVTYLEAAKLIKSIQPAYATSGSKSSRSNECRQAFYRACQLCAL